MSLQPFGCKWRRENAHESSTSTTGTRLCLLRRPATSMREPTIFATRSSRDVWRALHIFGFRSPVRSGSRTRTFHTATHAHRCRPPARAWLSASALHSASLSLPPERPCHSTRVRIRMRTMRPPVCRRTRRSVSAPLPPARALARPPFVEIVAINRNGNSQMAI